VRVPGLEPGEPGHLDERSRLPPALGRGHAQLLEPELDVALHRALWKEGELLEHHRGQRPPGGGDSNVTSPDDMGRSPATALSSVDLPQPEGPSRDDELPRAHAEAHVAERVHGMALMIDVGLRHPIDDDAHQRRRKRWIFPVAVFGRSSTTSMRSGIL